MTQNPQNSRMWHACALCFACLALASTTYADDPQTTGGTEPPSTFVDALAAGKTTVDLRYRFELVDQDGFDRDAEASTLRTTLSYGSSPFRGFRFFVEAENVSAVIDDNNYNNAGADDLNNGVRDRPVVADPELTQISQAYVEMAIKSTTLRLGRQAINLENQRFVGAVGWRQHHQTFNAFSLQDRSFGAATVSYHYLDAVNRIFGDRRDMQSHLLHSSVPIGQHNKLSLYGYFLDYEEPADQLLSTSTYGLRWAGHGNLNRAKISYTLEAALQEDAGDNPRQIDADYLLAELAAGSERLTATVGYEVLSGSPADGAFATPLATLHKFNGWADKFLRTPSFGLVDTYAKIGGAVRSFSWSVIYHDFQSDSSLPGNDDHYGSEIDALATYKTQHGLVLGLKAAFYDANRVSTDTDKIMLWTSYSFGH